MATTSENAPNKQHRVVCRLRSRSDAEGHLQVLRHVMPNLTFTIMFDITPERRNPPTQKKHPQSNPNKKSSNPDCF
ncbi:MAG: hypothetical protein LDL41_17805 [Coleofasciculus sp. S288]|nr:hypothetical protein [Coleofasciculus sp. S288]